MPVRLPGLQNSGWYRDRQAEVDHLDDAVLRHHDVARADVAVQEALLVHVLQAVGDLRQDS